MKTTTLALAMFLVCVACSPAQKNLHDAVQTGTADDVIALLNAGADPNSRNKLNHTPLHGAVMFYANPTIITALLKAGSGSQR